MSKLLFPSERSWLQSLGPVLAASVCLSAGSAKADEVDPYWALDQLGQTLTTVEKEYFQEVDQSRLTVGAMRGLVAELDPHSTYLSAEELRIFEGDTSGQFGGIGLEVDFRNNEVVVISPVDGSPAARAGIRVGDRIIAIEGFAAAELKPYDIVKKMRGPVGTKVRLTLIDSATEKPRELTLVREQISVKSVTLVPLKNGTIYVRIKAFQEGTHAEFESLMATQKDYRGLVLDLRNNPGGLVKEAVAIADEFLDSGEIYSMRARGTLLRSAQASAGGIFEAGPVVVLVNEFSASAAELVAGALKDRGRAVTVGSRTFGKGSVQSLLPLSYGGALKLTTALYYTPSGHTLQAEGVTPDVVVAAKTSDGTDTKVLSERDLEGHIPSETPSGEAESAGLPRSDSELHLGVTRTIPFDPSNSGDLALREGYAELLKKLGLKSDSNAASSATPSAPAP